MKVRGHMDIYSSPHTTLILKSLQLRTTIFSMFQFPNFDLFIYYEIKSTILENA